MKYLVPTILATVLAVSVQAQQVSLVDKLAEASAEWLIGTWTGTDDGGDTVTITYASEFDGKAGSVHLKGNSIELKGLIGVDPVTDEVRQHAVTSIGAVLAGTWDDNGSGLTFHATWHLPDGATLERVYVHESDGSDSMRVTVYDGPQWKSTTSKQMEMTLKRVR